MTTRDETLLTAYALGECDDAERVEAERLLAADPAARSQVDEVRAAAAALAAGFAKEPVPAVPAAQREAVVARLRALASKPAPRPRWIRTATWASSIAATLVLVLTVGALIPGGGGHGFQTSVTSAPDANGDGSAEAARINGGTMTMKQILRDTPGGAQALEKGGKAQYERNVEYLNELSKVTGYSSGVDAAAGVASVGAGNGGRGLAGPVPPGLREPRDYRVMTHGVLGCDGEWNYMQAVNGIHRYAPSTGGGSQAMFLFTRRTGSDLPALKLGFIDNLDDVTNGLAQPRGVMFDVLRATDGTYYYVDAKNQKIVLEAATVAEALGNESYAPYVENPLLLPRQAPLSTFSIDVDTASYANVRRMLNEGMRPPAEAVRVEELVNYFPYQYAGPTDDRPFAVHLEVAACPWALEHRLVRIGLKARDVERKARPASNIVFLLDVSGSMDHPNKLPLVKASMRMLLEELNERDYVSIVTYAGESGVALEPTSCEKKDVIGSAIDALHAGGSTNGASGIRLAYDTAAKHLALGGVNRVVLCTDGDFNVGVTSHDDLLALITEKAKSGVFLTVLGYGMGNYKDDRLELLADKGNGNYGYVDTTAEARKILVEQAGGTLVTVAKDVKIQVEFNPATVAAYRLVGYENRRLAAKDFADDTKDAGEIGAGHTVTALYEIVPAGKAVPATSEGETLKYQRVAEPAPAAGNSPELLTVKLRYKDPAGTASKYLEFPLTDGGAAYGQASGDFKFAASVASFALLLRDSQTKGTASFDGVLELAGEGLSFDPSGYRKEFVALVAKAKGLIAPPAPGTK